MKSEQHAVDGNLTSEGPEHLRSQPLIALSSQGTAGTGDRRDQRRDIDRARAQQPDHTAERAVRHLQQHLAASELATLEEPDVRRHPTEMIALDEQRAQRNSTTHVASSSLPLANVDDARPFPTDAMSSLVTSMGSRTAPSTSPSRGAARRLPDRTADFPTTSEPRGRSSSSAACVFRRSSRAAACFRASGSRYLPGDPGRKPRTRYGRPTSRYPRRQSSTRPRVMAMRCVVGRRWHRNRPPRRWLGARVLSEPTRGLRGSSSADRTRSTDQVARIRSRVAPRGLPLTEGPSEARRRPCPAPAGASFRLPARPGRGRSTCESPCRAGAPS